MSFMPTVTPQKIFISYWLTVMLGTFFVMVNFTSAFFEFPASSDTLMVRVHSSDIVVPDETDFQFTDNSTWQSLVLLSLQDATRTSQINSWFPLMLISFHHVMSTSLLFIWIVGGAVSFPLGLSGLAVPVSSGSSPPHPTNNEAADKETTPVNAPVAVHKPKVVVVARSAATNVFLFLR